MMENARSCTAIPYYSETVVVGVDVGKVGWKCVNNRGITLESYLFVRYYVHPTLRIQLFDANKNASNTIQPTFN